MNAKVLVDAMRPYVESRKGKTKAENPVMIISNSTTGGSKKGKGANVKYYSINVKINGKYEGISVKVNNWKQAQKIIDPASRQYQPDLVFSKSNMGETDWLVFQYLDVCIADHLTDARKKELGINNKLRYKKFIYDTYLEGDKADKAREDPIVRVSFTFTNKDKDGNELPVERLAQDVYDKTKEEVFVDDKGRKRRKYHTASHNGNPVNIDNMHEIFTKNSVIKSSLTFYISVTSAIVSSKIRFNSNILITPGKTGAIDDDSLFNSSDDEDDTTTKMSNLNIGKGKKPQNDDDDDDDDDEGEQQADDDDDDDDDD
jgi:hypothetical protein